VIGLCTDSSAQVPPELAARHGIEIVPITVTFDDTEHLDGVEFDLDAFYERFRAHDRLDFATSDPSPGQFAAAYEDLIARGCTEILSLHTAGALNAARLAAHATSVPVRVIDPGVGGFGISCAAWASGAAIERGASIDQAATVAERLALSIDNMFVVGTDGNPNRGLALLTYHHGEPELVQRCDSTFDAVNLMASRVVARGQRLRVAVGHSDAATVAVANALESAVGEPANVIDVVRYRIGPGGGGQAMPGTVSCFTFPVD
jgi:fatty acid-binding protein DegV